MIPRPWMKIRVKRQLCGCLRVCWLGTGDFRARDSPWGWKTFLIMTGTRPECQSLATKHTSSP